MVPFRWYSDKMGLNDLSLDCACCGPPILYKATLVVRAHAYRAEGDTIAGSYDWAALQDPSWQAVRDEAFSLIESLCNTPSESDIGQSLIEDSDRISIKRHCPAAWMATGDQLDGNIAGDYRFSGNASRWGQEFQVGGANSRPPVDCNPPGPPYSCSGLFTDTYYHSALSAVFCLLPVGSTMLSAYGVATIRYHIVSHVREFGSPALFEETMVEALNLNGYCNDSPPPPKDCYEVVLTNGNAQILYGSMPSVGEYFPGGLTGAQALALWESALGGTQDQIITPDMGSLTIVAYDATGPCTHVSTDGMWFTAVAPDGLCFGGVPGLDASAPHPATILTSLPVGCNEVDWFYAGNVSRQQIKAFHCAHVVKIQLLDSVGNVIAEITI
jgi:hypothetical protein